MRFKVTSTSKFHYQLLIHHPQTHGDDFLSRLRDFPLQFLSHNSPFVINIKKIYNTTATHVQDVEWNDFFVSGNREGLVLIEEQRVEISLIKNNIKKWEFSIPCIFHYKEQQKEEEKY